MIRILLVTFCAIFCNSLESRRSYPINPWNLSIHERIINRKHVSHLLIDTRRNGFRVTLLVADRFPYNYKAQSYPLFIRANSAREAQELLHKLDSYLQTGENLYIRINGTEIVKYRFLAGQE
ncbi:MAG: hypothetical protein AAF518_09570 [Spirochaetota bacterium]